MATELQEACRQLVQLAEGGIDYRRDQVFLLMEEDSEITGTGFDLERKVPVNVAGVTIVTTAELRVIAMKDGNLFIRTWLKWMSSFGDHRSFVSYDLSPASIERIALQPADEDQGGDSVSEMNDYTKAFSLLLDHMEIQDSLGGTWNQEYPDFSQKTTKHHEEVVLAARTAEPGLLNMLSDTDMGAINAQEIIDLCEWFKRQPEVNAE